MKREEITSEADRVWFTSHTEPIPLSECSVSGFANSPAKKEQPYVPHRFSQRRLVNKASMYVINKTLDLMFPYIISTHDCHSYVSNCRDGYSKCPPSTDVQPDVEF